MTITNNTKLSEKELLILKEKSKLPTNDLVFHALFGAKGSEKITQKFLETILKKSLQDINLDLNLNLVKEYYDDKLGILDVRAKDTNGTNYNIEMQNSTSATLPERILSYWARLFNGDLHVGDSYVTLRKTIAILILNDDMENLDIIKKFHTKWNIREETYTDIILTDYLEIHIIELPKYLKMRTEENKNMWLDFILQPQGKEVLEAMKKSKELKNAKNKWDKITQDRKLRDRALRLEIARLDYNTGIQCAEEKGFANGKNIGFAEGKNIGLAEGKNIGLAEGKNIGLAEGKNIGLAEGKAIGLSKGKMEIAKKMLKMNIDIETISTLTELSVEEITTLKE